MYAGPRLFRDPYPLATHWRSFLYHNSVSLRLGAGYNSEPQSHPSSNRDQHLAAVCLFFVVISDQGSRKLQTVIGTALTPDVFLVTNNVCVYLQWWYEYISAFVFVATPEIHPHKAIPDAVFIVSSSWSPSSRHHYSPGMSSTVRHACLHLKSCADGPQLSFGCFLCEESLLL